MILRIERPRGARDGIGDGDHGRTCAAILFPPQTAFAVAIDMRRRSTDDAVAVGQCLRAFVDHVRRIRRAFDRSRFDIDPDKVTALNAGRSYIAAVSNDDLAKLVQQGRFRASADFSELGQCDVIIICVPTPLTKYREPDLYYVEETTRTIARTLRSGQLVVLESTTYPGTTDEVVRPLLEATGRKSGVDFFLGFSPEREDPGNRHFGTATIPKVIAGDGSDAPALMAVFYGGSYWFSHGGSWN